MRLSSAAKAANIERLQSLLSELADTSGAIRGWSLWKLTEAFNIRYVKEIQPVSSRNIQEHMKGLVISGWLTSQPEGRHGRLMWTLQDGPV